MTTKIRATVKCHSKILRLHAYCPYSSPCQDNYILSTTVCFIACERRRISGCHLVPPKKNVCDPEPENDFCDAGILSQSQFSSNNPRTTARGIRCEEHLSFILSWNLIGQGETKVITSQKSFPGSGLQTLFFGGTKWQPEIRLRSQAICFIISSSFFSSACEEELEERPPPCILACSCTSRLIFCFCDLDKFKTKLRVCGQNSIIIKLRRALVLR